MFFRVVNIFIVTLCIHSATLLCIIYGNIAEARIKPSNLNIFF